MRRPLSHDKRAQAAASLIQFGGLTGKKNEENREEAPDRTSTRSSLGAARYLLSLRIPVNLWGSRRFDEVEVENFRAPQREH